jgi:hypothetical protein
MVVSSEPLSEIKRGQIEMLAVTGGELFLAARGPPTATRGKTARGMELVEDPTKGANRARTCVLSHPKGFHSIEAGS